MLKKKIKIMYIAPFYCNGSVFYSVMMPDIVLMDWQLRLLNFLSENRDYKILIKQHPESIIRMPQYFFDNFRLKDISGSFESVYKKADILLFDYPLTTTFGYAFTTKKPIIFIDFGFHQLLPKEREMLNKRCYVIDGKFLIDNRAETDWNDLKLGLEKCFDYNYTSYGRYVL